MAGPNPPDPYPFNTSTFLTKPRQFAWLDRSSTWPDLPATQWTPVKVLAATGSGAVGLFKHVGSNPRVPSHMVVKQVFAEGVNELANESRLLRMLTGTGTKHVVKLYKAFERVMGTGATGEDTFDALPFDEDDGEVDDARMVGRMYIEYVEGGDLAGWKDKYREGDENRRKVIPEEVLWRMMGCLVRAVLVLETGSEFVTVPNISWGKKIIHFDLKLENVLVGPKDQAYHQRFPMLKLTDFGMSQFEPSTRAQRAMNVWIGNAVDRATPGWFAPEQRYPEHQNRDMSAKLNMWGIGSIIYRLICRKNTPDPDMPTFLHSFNGKPLEVVGDPKLLLSPIQCPYSAKFITTLCALLIWNPAQRMRAATLSGICDQMIDLYDGLNSVPPRGPTPKPPPGTIPPIPPPGPGGEALLGPNVLPGGGTGPNALQAFVMPNTTLRARDPELRAYQYYEDFPAMSPDPRSGGLLFRRGRRQRPPVQGNYFSEVGGEGEMVNRMGMRDVWEVVDPLAFPGEPIPSPRFLGEEPVTPEPSYESSNSGEDVDMT
ncbi:kinase-like protein [Mollisia scopiformis]|uniref:Kinase-like protein n=1 Tax=Mollisia scopiformis TaxID=149040 RepID=A0A194XFX7_MOLSC|nr:kinase-like protein [Mollisia scopiformis]KUJ18677.1 kinase-like protein [Mollisia scopiformis]